MKTIPWIGLFLCTLSIAALAWTDRAWADRSSARVTIEVPPQIKSAVEREVGSGRLLGLSTGQDEQKNLIYVAHAEIDGWAYTLRIDLDGSLIDNECDEPDPPEVKVTLQDLPAATLAKIKSQSAGGALTEPTREEYQAIYEVHTQIDGRKLLSKERLDDDQPGDKKTA
jgi:hypothetical protein